MKMQKYALYPIQRRSVGKHKKHAADSGVILMVVGSHEETCLYRRMLERSDTCDRRLMDVSTGLQELAFLASHAVDCVLLDYRLPDMDVLKFLSLLNQRQMADALSIILLFD
jgi:CheY-like chemotaxis protein